jgi:regulator of protease activity HflC (stomatin/prohibitin superfamily)
MPYIIVGMAILVILIIFGSQMFIIIQARERGVIFRSYTSGLDKEYIYGEGYHIVAPCNTMNIYNMRELQRDETMNVSDHTRLYINVDATVRYNLIFNQIGFIYLRFGLDYSYVLVIPEDRSFVRQVLCRCDLFYQKG